MIVVPEIGPESWQHLLDYLSGNYVLIYSEDGAETQLPDIESIWQAYDEKSLALEIMLPGFTVNSHFSSKNFIEMNLLPEDVDSSEKAEAVFQLLSGMASVLETKVFLTPVFGSATFDKLRELSICIADPKSNSISCRLEDE